MKFKIVFLIVAVLTVTAGFSQDDSESPNTLENQYRDLKKESNNYQIYKVVKESSLDEFWKSVADSLRNTHATIQSLNAEVADLKAQVKNLHNQVDDRDGKLADQEFNIEHMSFLGISLTKATYVTFTWTIIFILLSVAIILFFRFKNANTVTVRTRKEFSQLQEEFESQRKKARETESKIKRELQTELNLVEELKSKLGEH